MSSRRVSSPAAKKQAAKAVPMPVSTIASHSLARAAGTTTPAPVPGLKGEPFVLSTFVEVWWTVFFAAGVLAMQSFVEPKQGWSWPPNMDLSGKQAMSVVSSHWFWACWIPMILGVLWCRSFFKKHVIASAERGMMMWWLTNACFFHIHCDILSGYYQVMPALTQIYAEISPAHKQHRWADARLHLDSTYFLELFFEAPFAVLMLILYMRRHPARHLMEIFAVAVQFAGTVIYYVPRFMKLETPTSWVCYFDCAFGFVWIAFPLAVLRRHWVAAVQANAKKS